MARHLVMLFIAIALSGTGTFAQATVKGDSLDVDMLLTLGENIIFGRNLRATLDFTAAGSRLVTTSKSVSLRDILSGQDQSTTIAEDSTTRHLSRIAMESNDIDDAAVLQLATADKQGKDIHNHVVFLLKNKEHHWIIAVWRAPD